MEFKDTRGARRYNMAKKKISENPKAVDARARKEDKKQAVKSSKEKAEEDAMWNDDDKKLAKAAAKKADDERKKAEAAAKKAEMKALLKADEEALALKPKKAPAQKVTQHELHTKKVKAEEAARLAQIEKDRQNGIVTQDHLETFENQNRELAEERADGSVMATGLDAAITDLSIGVKSKTAKVCVLD
ncbi:hypothetical protein SARC_01628 [Sphaeroforma arctica JP610]|uniref:Uncharacterized protein n=1 Tax=Sphaeroforma arctica JP610 TaxID=667725 RepID=A0A0L0GD98_9EUKA|nr:hypothetical protein SARC_01628 [Sphaeroforma arctica JP610]KNC86218.1 hypothetical protein SARC_01628 [Sphaeroforma arctica JP610]|eukprot:XP_014160120.1 hypothetical protein SARC_01628 [Sphaeroforma arctica JP610]